MTETPDTARTLSPAERTMLGYALDQAQERIWSEGGFTEEDQAAVDSLRRLTAVVPVSSPPADQTALREIAAQAIRDSNGSPEALAWWTQHPQLIPAHVYADAVLAVLPTTNHDTDTSAAPVDRAAVLREAADVVANHPGPIPYRPQLDEDGGFWWDTRDRDAVVALLRRVADETAATETPAPHRSVSLATPCTVCTHPYNWHTRRHGRCEFAPLGKSGCDCAGFVPGERPEPVDPCRILGIDPEFAAGARQATEAAHGLSVQHADALWDAVAFPGPDRPTYPQQHQRVCRAVREILDETAATETQPPTPTDCNSGPGWYEVVTPRATTCIAYVHEDGSLYLPEGDPTEEEFAFAAARGMAHRLVRADEQHAAGARQDEAQPCPAKHGALGRICELHEGHPGMHTGSGPNGAAVWDGDAP
ncbi:hypothetical protein [Streptomyces parvulus]|uniref:hypothetical protein n=1 Tax=Streptomyces parvulus TaxID=146923 RepID=UPI00339FB190